MFTAQKSNGPFPLPGNHEKKITEAIQTGDPSFHKDDFIRFAQDVFCRIQKALSSGDLIPVRQFMQDDFYLRQQKQLDDFHRAGLLPVTDSVQIQRSCLHFYERNKAGENLTVFLTVAMRQYLLDKQSLEVADGDKDDILQFYYFLTFQRKNGAATDLSRSADSGGCRCNPPLTNGDCGWTVCSLSRIHDFSNIDERGVVLYDC